MGTFHDNKHALHGITVVVKLADDRVIVGRCDDLTDAEIFIWDADEHTNGDDGRTTDEYLARAVQFGVWPKHKRLVIPVSDVTDVRPLGEYA